MKPGRYFSSSRLIFLHLLNSSLDFSNRRNGFNTAQSFEPQNVPLLGLGTVELDSVPYRNVTEKNFTSHDTSAWLGSGTSGTVFKMNFMGKRQVAVKQIPKSDDPDEIKVFSSAKNRF